MVLMVYGFGVYHSTGMVDTTRKPGSIYNGCSCHGASASPSVQVIISGPDSLGVGQVGTYTLYVINDTNIAAGFNVAAFLGDLMVGDTLDQQLLDGELTHTVPKFSNGGDTISWLFRYQSPDVSTFDTLYAVGNSVDTSYDPKGDFWNFSDNFIVRVGNPTSVVDPVPFPAHYQLFQNYPNPFNPSTKILYSLAKPSHVRLSVFDLHGRLVSILVDKLQQAGVYEVTFEVSQLSSGVYLYRMEAEGSSQTRKMVVLR